MGSPDIQPPGKISPGAPPAPDFRAGFVSIVGKPNVGKSTLMNQLIGERLSIITSKAQTTRHRIMGILNGNHNGQPFQLVYSDTPSSILKLNMKVNKLLDLTWSLGMTVAKGAKVNAVVWGGPAYDAGVTVGQEIVAVNGLPYTDDILKDAVTLAKGTTAPIRLTLKNELRVRDVNVQWNSGHRYPRFEKVGKGDGALDRLLAPKP